MKQLALSSVTTFCKAFFWLCQYPRALFRNQREGECLGKRAA